MLPIGDENVKGQGPAFVTISLIVLNVLAFFLEINQPSEAHLQAFVEAWGVVPREYTEGVDLAPQIPYPIWSTLFTSMFLHGGWGHLLGNMLFLWVFGDNIEDALGHVKFAAFYLACAALSGLVYILFAMGTYTWLIGASGAVAGVMGAYIVLYPHARVYVLLGLAIPIPLPLPALWMLGAWAAVQVFYLVIGDTSPVAWSAHIGGLVAGAALCVPLKRRDVVLFGGR